MPLIVICGFPASGKSTRAKEIYKFLTEQENRVHLVTENEFISKAGFSCNSCFNDTEKEKLVRSELKSKVERLLNKDEVVICDGINYIKGFRYELFCVTKTARTTHCTLFCATPKDRAWEFNELRSQKSSNTYKREVFEGLCMRFEEPRSNCRWDNPLFLVYPEESLDFESINCALFNVNPLSSNQSTQNPPLSSTNYLFDFDRITQEIVTDLLAAHKIGMLGPQFVKGSDTELKIPFNINSAQLNRLRRQFINYSKLHYVSSTTLDKVPQLFVQFLNTCCNQK